MDEVAKSTWDTVSGFVGGRNAFIASISLLFAYLFVMKIIRWVRDTVVFVLALFLNPLRFRKVFFNFISLIFMVGGTASAGAAKAKLGGSDGTLEAFVAGGCALALWGFVMLCFNNLREYRAEKAIGEKPIK